MNQFFADGKDINVVSFHRNMDENKTTDKIKNINISTTDESTKQTLFKNIITKINKIFK
jgi:hypothetical protein